MAKKQVKKPVAEAKKLTAEERMKFFKGDLLDENYNEGYLKRVGLYERTLSRKARYWCFKIRHATIKGKSIPNYPKGFKEFVESLYGFAGWPYFAVTWDLYGGNPFMIVLRLQSVWEEWDQVMNRVSIPIDTPPDQIHDRIQALEDEYARKEAKNKR